MMPVCTTNAVPRRWWQGQSFEADFLVFMMADPQLVYTLAPGVLEKARSLYYWRTGLDFGSTIWSIVVLLAVLNFRWAAGLGAWSAAVTRKSWLQGFASRP